MSSGTNDAEGALFIDVSQVPSTMTTLDQSTERPGGDNVSGTGLSIDFQSRFVPYTTVSVCCLLFNGVALAALGFVRGPRTVHQRLLANLTIGDVVGTVLLWLYNNSPFIFPRFQVNLLLLLIARTSTSISHIDVWLRSHVLTVPL